MEKDFPSNQTESGFNLTKFTFMKGLYLLEGKGYMQFQISNYQA